MTLPVLLYHNVGTSMLSGYRQQTISPVQFETHLAWLDQHGYSGVRLADWVAHIRGDNALPGKPVLITFDDGYADLAEHALPVLKRYGFGACIFLVTRRLGMTNTWDEGCGYETRRLLSADEVVQLAASGMDFGSHGRTHADLTTMTPVECDREVKGSRDDLADLLGYQPLAFAYPYGGFNSQVVARVRNTYGIAFTVRRGVNTRRTNILLLRRSVVSTRDSLRDFGHRVRFGVSPAAIMRRLRGSLRAKYRA